MSLMNTVTKMAIGFAMAKGMEAVQKSGGVESLMQNLSGAGGQQAGALGGLQDMLGQLGAAGAAGGAPGGLGDLIGQFTDGGQNSANPAQGGLGGLGALLGGLAGARGGGAGSLEALLGQDNPVDEPDPEETARLMMRAMIQAARADGDIDPDEKAKLLDALRDGDPSDMEAVQSILTEPVSPQNLAAETPKGLETQVYTMALNAINPDNQAEAEFLHTLADGLSIQPDTVNQIHKELGVTRLYS